MSMKDSYTAKDLIRRLKDKSHGLRKWSEDLEKEADVVMDLVKQKEEKIQKLENHNKTLAKINESLSMELKEKSSKAFPLSESKTKKERSITFKTASEAERVIGHQFQDSKAAQKSDKSDLKEQLTTPMPQMPVLPAEDHGCAEITPMLQEDEATNTVKELHTRSEPLSFIHCPWDLLKILLVILVSFGFCTTLILAYVYFFNSNFIAHRLPVLFNDHDLAELTQLFSPYLTWENDGLLPF